MKTVVIMAHPNIQASRINRAWAQTLEQAGFMVRRLHDLYPDWKIDVEAEQAALLAHDRFVLQFPFYWYSCPPMMKKWLDDVLTIGWAYGRGGDKLHGKEMVIACSTGGPAEAYGRSGYNSYTMLELLRPFQQTANLIGASYLRPFIIQGARMQTDESIAQSASSLAEYLHRPALPTVGKHDVDSMEMA